MKQLPPKNPGFEYFIHQFYTCPDLCRCLQGVLPPHTTIRRPGGACASSPSALRHQSRAFVRFPPFCPTSAFPPPFPQGEKSGFLWTHHFHPLIFPSLIFL